MPAAAEVELFLSSYEAGVIAEARQLVESRSVRVLRNTPDFIEAEVALEEECAHTTLRKLDGEWSGHADIENREALPIALCASMLEAEASAESESAEDAQPQKTFRELVEAKLGRTLSGSEEQYASKVDSRFERFRKGGSIFDHDLVRIQPRWPVEGYEALRLWPSPPEDVLSFWNYIAAAFAERKLNYPPVFECITDLAATRAKLETWRQSEDLPRWAQCIREFNRHNDPPLAHAEVRLIVTCGEVRFQIKNPRESKWRAATEQELRDLLAQHEQTSLRCMLGSRLIIESVMRALRDDALPVVRLDEHNIARWLGTLILQPEMREQILTLDESPFEFAPEPLRWSAREHKQDRDRASVILTLSDANGHDSPRPLRFLPGAVPLYLSPDTIYRGPPAFFPTTTVPASVELPWAAIANEEGVTFFTKLGTTLPPNLESKVRRENFRVEFTARCLPRAEQGGTEHVAVTVEAVSSDGLLRQSLRGHHWDTSRLNPEEGDDSIRCYDRAALDQTHGSLEKLNASFDLELDAFRVRITKQFPERFLEWARTLPEGLSLNADDRLQTILADPLKATVRFEIEETGIDWFDLRLVFDIEGVQLKPAEIRRLIAARGGFVRLADGSWRSVVLELTDEQRQAIEGLGLDMQELSDEAHPLHLRQLAQQERRGMIAAELWDQLKQRLSRLDVHTKPEAPSLNQITLRQYQVDGFHFLVYLTVNRFGGVLADDMGLGKTLQSISWILWLRSLGEQSSPCLVVCPKSVLDVWATEFAKAAPQLRVQVLRDKDELDIEFVRDGADVLVINYAQLRSCIEALQKITWLAAILDEGQQIKNPDSKVAKAARQLHAENRLVLTGTPVENRLLDLWSLMSFATPGALGDRAYFQKHFDRRKDDRAAERLTSRLKPFIMRRTKGQVARELPPRTEENISCEMSPLQEQLYREHLSAAQHMLLTAAGSEALQKRRFAILQAITRLRQICCHPALVNPDAQNEESAKLNALLDLLDQLHDEGHKVLVFSQFVKMLNIIRDKLVALDRPFHYLTGASRDRAQIVDAFQNDPDPAVFLLSLKAGGSGLNLTAASYVILFDPWWNPAVENQAIDRAHRIGQTQPVMAYRLITRDSIEEKIRRLQMQKSLMSSDVLGEERFTAALDRRDLEYLFELGSGSSGKD